MIKRIVHSPDLELQLTEEQMRLAQMLELLAITKLLKRFCINLQMLDEQVPAPQVHCLLEQTKAEYAQAVKHLMLLQSVLIEPEPPSNDT